MVSKRSVKHPFNDKYYLYYDIFCAMSIYFTKFSKFSK